MNFTQLVSRKMVAPDELWDFSEFYAKVFSGNKIYSGGFKGCALLWKYLQNTCFDLSNPEHIAALKRFDWTDEDNLYASKLNSNEDSRQFGARLIKVWTDYEKEAGIKRDEEPA